MFHVFILLSVSPPHHRSFSLSNYFCSSFIISRTELFIPTFRLFPAFQSSITSIPWDQTALSYLLKIRQLLGLFRIVCWSACRNYANSRRSNPIKVHWYRFELPPRRGKKLFRTKNRFLTSFSSTSPMQDLSDISPAIFFHIFRSTVGTKEVERILQIL